LVRKPCILLLAFLCLLLSCHVKEKWHTSTLLAFDTVCEIRIYCSGSAFKSAQEEVHRIFSEIESHFSPGTENYSSPIVLNLFKKALRVYHDSPMGVLILQWPLYPMSGDSLANPSLCQPLNK